LDPTSSGTVVLHAEVPVAVPEIPNVFDHVTFVTPTLSLEVPWIVNEVAAVDAVPVEGDVIISAGADVSGPVGTGTLCRVMVTDCDTRLVPLNAEIVIVFTPTASGMPVAVHVDDPAAEPAAPVDDVQDTVIAPAPPAVVPERSAVALVVVVEARALIVSASRCGLGGGGGGGAGVGSGVGVGSAVRGS
jgi:hypothetical protein